MHKNKILFKLSLSAGCDYEWMLMALYVESFNLSLSPSAVGLDKIINEMLGMFLLVLKTSQAVID